MYLLRVPHANGLGKRVRNYRRQSLHHPSRSSCRRRLSPPLVMEQSHNPYPTPQSSTAPMDFPTPFSSNSNNKSNHQSDEQNHILSRPHSNLHSINTHQSPAHYSHPPSATVMSPHTATASNSARALSNPPTFSTQTVASTSPTAERRLPPTDFADDQAFEDAYVAYVLYCNPTIPSDVDTADLRRNFGMPPRSDNKSFNTEVLFQLLQRLDSKDIKTWVELALELGVERPNIEKGQSSQKVQQYSVRLKRWLRASHIDSFFDYMMGKDVRENRYLLHIPPFNDPYPDERDGVSRDDDLALRALKPEFRPKRGRRRAEDIDDYEPTSASASDPKRPHLDITPTDYAPPPQSAYPASAHPDSQADRLHDQWLSPSQPSMPAPTPASAATRTSPASAYRFHYETPSTPHPLSEMMTPQSAHPDSTMDDSFSALSNSQKLRMRRRHGTAVSSAWPGNNTTPNGKLRGRPPANRSTKDGPYVTFSAKGPNDRDFTPPPHHSTLSSSLLPPSHTSAGVSSNNTRLDSPFRIPTHLPTPISATSPPSHSIATAPNYHPPPSLAPPAPGRPDNLRLQVPQHLGNPVRLATPTVMVNGGATAVFERPDSPPRSKSHQHHHYQQYYQPQQRFSEQAPSASHHQQSQPQLQTQDLYQPRQELSVLAEEVRRWLVADLIRADVSGRPKSLRSTEAKGVADALLHHASGGWFAAMLSDSKDQGDEQALLQYESNLRILYTAASWLGVNGNIFSNNDSHKNGKSNSSGNSNGNTALSNSGIKRVTVRRWRVSSDGYEDPIDDDDNDSMTMDTDDNELAAAATNTTTTDAAAAKNDKPVIKFTYDVEWDLTISGITGKFGVKGLSSDSSGTKNNNDANGTVSASTAIGAILASPFDVHSAVSAAATATDPSPVDIAALPEEWRRRVADMKDELQQARAELHRVRDEVLQAALR